MFRAGDEEEVEVEVPIDSEAWHSYQEFFPQVESTEIVYQRERKKLKLIGPYIMGDQLGTGSYSKVKECMHSVTLRRMAVKIMNNRNLQRITNGQKDAKKEIRLLRRLHHPNVVSLEDVIYNHRKLKIYVFMEFCVGSLHELIVGAPNQRLPAWQAQHYFGQLMQGLGYLHSQCVVHRDVKPMNLLLTTDGCLKISDLGVADELEWYAASDDKVSATPGTPIFQAPELARGDEKLNGFKLDVWAAGVTLWYMLWGSPPFDVPQPGTEAAFVLACSQIVGRGEYKIPADADDTLRSLILGVMNVNAKARFTVDNALQHPWLKIRLEQKEPEVRFKPSPSNDPYRGTTVLPYLKDLFDESQSESGTIDSHESEPSSPAVHTNVVNDVAFSFDSVSSSSAQSASPRSNSFSSGVRRLFSSVMRKDAK
eukprot:m.88547 g.88547  ORF g.88547 m.88547 type:complete len:424 (+) comp15193_c0_seq1:133-1404(+)